MNVNTLTLDVSKEPAHEPTIYLGQGDKNGTTLVVNLFDNGSVLDLTDKTVSFLMRTPGGTDYYQVTGTVSGNTATFVIDETYAAGHVGSTDVAYVKVDDGDTIITSTSRIRVTVLPSATEGVEPAPAYETAIDEFLDDAQAQVDEIIEEVEAIIDYSVPLMSSSTRGGAKLGSGLTVDASEKLNIATASTSALGGVKVGNGLEMDANDKLNVTPATTSAIGGVIPDGSSITVDADGTIHGQAGGVTGVKGDSESSYRTGNVNITAANVGAAASSHTHSATDITSGELAIANGGTGVSTAALARAELGSIPMGTCNSISIATDKNIFPVTLNGFEPFSGARILVKFSSAKQGYSYLPDYLSINSTYQAAVYAGGLITGTNNQIDWSANAICEFVYDGSHWNYLGNNIDGYEDYAAGQAVADLATYTGANGTSYAAYGTIQHQVDTLRDSVAPFQFVVNDGAISVRIQSGSDAVYFIYYRSAKLLKASIETNGTWLSEQTIASW